MRRRCSLNLLAVVHLGHTANSSTSKARVLVAISPAVNSSLDQPSLAAQRWVELCQSPSDTVAVCLVHQAVSTVLILGAACSRVDTVLLLELGREVVGVDRLNIASNSVLHLDTVSRVLKCNPLNTIAILSHNQRSSGGNGSGCSVGINSRCGVAWTLQLRCVGLVLSLWHR